jgi:uncharacterized oligopeptide transporter (OPT) family protein
MAKKPETESVAQEVIDEARIVLPGIQALFGFQLIAVFNERFHSLPSLEQDLHYAALILVAMAIAVIMTPAAYHRIVEQTTVSEFFIKLASWLIAAAMLPLMTAIALESYIVGVVLFGRGLASVVIAALLFCLFAGLWFALPLAMRRRRR